MRPGILRGLWQAPGSGQKRLLIGSHIDTVPDAGAYDGVLGVALALELVALAQENKIPLSVEVIAFSVEEGIRFGVPFLGSRAVAGRFDPALLALKDADGFTLEETIREFGLDPDGLETASAHEDSVGFFEIHIEQGPVLDTEGLKVAAVTGIVGQTRVGLEFRGHANHAGTTPMHLRRDALAAAAEWISAVETASLKTEGLVATVGKLSVRPNAANVIPASAELSLRDVRHASDAARRNAVDNLREKAGAIAERRQLQLEWNRKSDEPAVPMDERLTAFLVDAMETCGFPARRMSSGAGHDAMVMAGRMPTAMLFLRSPGGISHHPSEAVRDEDVGGGLACRSQIS